MTGAGGSGATSGRDLARAVLLRVERDGAFAGRALAAALERAPGMSAPDRGLATELVYGVLRRRARLDRAIAALARKGIDALDLEVRIALRVGGYQLLFLDRVPAYAAVSDAVEACKQARGRGAAGFANAVLRKLARGNEPPLPAAAGDPAAFLEIAVGFPPWLARLTLAELPVADAIAFGEASAAAPPVTLRANTPRIGREALLERLRAERPEARLATSEIAPDAVLARGLEAPAATGAWRDGLFAVQDAGAQVIAELCGAAPGERILDACAGLGGKTAHLLALAGGRAQVDAADLSQAKLREAGQTLERLGLGPVRSVVADLTRPLAGELSGYDRVLLDAPCSGLGVLRRHPEALLRRTPADLAALAIAQRRMLDVVSTALRPGGLLVYAVCTFDRAECEEVVAGFLGEHPSFALEPAAAAGGRVAWDRLTIAGGPLAAAIRTWPQRDDADGFFAVRLRRAG
ncbi:MAG TPA: 16S rRNA (cytosine(967)-C(5))-methyltransferase RsmB [Polyangia bacterium]|nr:16S rRNA (cytosine(967)-C(5))-methyltransferase RsmB [Polyangia bacterium]